MDEDKAVGVVKLGLYGFLIVVLLVVVLSIVETVGAGSVKVVTRWGATTGRILQPGIHFLWPVADGTIKYNTKVLTYETSTEEKQKGSDADYKDFPVDTNTSNGQPVDIFYTIRFAVNGGQAADIANNIGNEPDLVEKIVKTESRIWVRNIPREFSSDELYTGDGVQKVQDRLREVLSPIFEKNGLRLDSVGIREIVFPASFVQKIQEKQEAEIQVETEKQRAEQAEYRKQATIREAEAQSKAQELQRQTLDPQVIEKLKVENERLKAEGCKILAEKGVKCVPENLTIFGSDGVSENFLFGLNLPR